MREDNGKLEDRLPSGTYGTILVAGGAGFIGSDFVRLLLEQDYERVIVVDKLTYAGNLDNLEEVRSDPRLSFIQGDICDQELIAEAAKGVDAIVNFAAETHVDRSLLGASEFIQTDVFGVYVLLETVKELQIGRFVHVSTDEVYGHVPVGSSKETDPLSPRNPYSASKAGGELMIEAYRASYGVPALITRGSNTYGPFQYPEKVLPISITNVLDGQPILIYGDGLQMRDWLHVRDHTRGIEHVLQHGVVGDVYNIGGGNERHNIDILEAILHELDAPAELLHFVSDRAGHDRRYSLDTSKIRELGWEPRVPLEQGLRETTRWYRDRRDWWEPIRQSPEYREYYDRNYAHRDVLKVGR